MPKVLAIAVAALLRLGAACSGGGDGDQAKAPGDPRSALTPTFEPADPGSTTSTSAGAVDGTTTSTTVAGAGDDTTTTTVAVMQGGPSGSASVRDAEGDVTLSVDPPPPWADLVAATLTLDDTGFELRVTLGGGDAPETTDEDHTMNVASFFDTDGDGAIDHEIWLNVASTGWGAGYFSPSGAKYVDESGVEITTEGADVVARFPWSHLRETHRFRWSIASEWSRYETLGTDLGARDDMPDDDQPVNFPS